VSDKKSFVLRIDNETYKALEKWASDEFRSVNAHIEFLLRDAARRAGRLSSQAASNDTSKSESTMIETNHSAEEK
jgi:hypothetical protein